MRHFLSLSDAGADGIAAMLADAIDRKAARRGWPKGRADADAPLADHALAMAAGEAVLDVIGEDGFLDHVTAMGDRLRQGLEQMIPNHDHLFEEVRGKGLMLGLKLKSDSRRFVAHCRDNHHLLTVAAGDNVMRILPPLIIDESHVAEFLQTLSDAARVYVPVADD